MSVMHRYVPVGWPIQYPFLAKAPFNNSANQPNCLKLQRGAKGYITQRSIVRGTEWVYCIIPGQTVQDVILKGWVPQDRLEIGIHRRYGEVQVGVLVTDNAVLHEADSLHEEHTYVKSFGPGTATSYRLSPFKACAKGDSTIVFTNGHRNNDGAFEISIDEPERPPDSSLVHVVFELTPKWPHPHAWARLPALGPWADWHFAHRLAVRCEWQDIAGTWKRTYVQSRDPPSTLVDAAIPGSFIIFARALTLIRSLRDQPVRHAPDWYRALELPTANIHTVTFDHLRQTQLICPCPHRRGHSGSDSDASSSFAAATNSIPWPGMLSLPFTERRLREAGARRIGGPVIYDADGCTEPCDTCFVAREPCMPVANGAGGGAGGASASGGIGKQCAACLLWCRPCSWTERIKFPARLVALLAVPARRQATVRDILDPGLVCFAETPGGGLVRREVGLLR